MAILVVLGLVLLLTPALNPLSPPPPPVAGDSFEAVRAKSLQAFERGKVLFSQDKLDQALVELDTASLNDPDHRADVQEMLQRTIDAIRARDAKTVAPVASRATPDSLGLPPTIGPIPGYEIYASDGQGIALLVPTGWNRTDMPVTEVGQGIVEFRDSAGKAIFTVARDAPGPDVTPEKYAAAVELKMQELHGYAIQQVQFVSVGYLPGVKRVFSLPGTSPAGREGLVREVQFVVGSGRQIFILTGEAGDGDFDIYRESFEKMVTSFRVR